MGTSTKIMIAYMTIATVVAIVLIAGFVFIVLKIF